ncbi:hypothetical protein HYPSUDRAFT_201939 [Hypholoma sublateritium FD-334 SS-4]|uniref:Uncharacterized protein n=1 Tax=Hypholoma sublateritium (strain FD-334 SS-4) TaxID=945553 RepID=A0A0D2NUS2_HYPSF|nr:hypothetical protein HYPSUDRAFT_201939 [Hypholoma sublateritium FD-334 SS-4]
MRTGDAAGFLTARCGVPAEDLSSFVRMHLRMLSYHLGPIPQHPEFPKSAATLTAAHSDSHSSYILAGTNRPLHTLPGTNIQYVDTANKRRRYSGKRITVLPVISLPRFSIRLKELTMIIDEKVIMPSPPAYLAAISPFSPSSSSQPGPSSAQFYAQAPISPAPSSYGSTLTLALPPPPKATLASLPAHILLQVIHHTFPHSKPQLPAYQAADTDADYAYVHGYTTRDSIAERQRRTLLWLATGLRLVSRTLYTACMHVLRSTYLPAYLALVRAPYTSDPFPMGAPASLPSHDAPAAQASAPPAYASSTHSRASAPVPEALAPLASPQRETAVLDRFIVLKIRHDVLMDESSLHLDRADAFRDLFDVAQPRARLEDLVRDIGARRGVVCVSNWGASAGPRVRRVGMDATVNGSSSSLQLLREVDAQIEARASAARTQGQCVPARAGKKSFFSFKKPSVPPSPPSSSSSSSSPFFTPPSRRTPSPYNEKSREDTSTWSAPPPALPAARLPSVQPLPFPALSVSFQPRRLGLVLARTRTLVEITRAPGRRETLEHLAALLVDALVRELGPG